MQLTLLISSLNNDVDELINKMNISSCAVIVNQCDKEDETVIEKDYGRIKVINSKGRGVGNNRNLCIDNSFGDIVLFADDDIVYDDGYEELVINEFQKHPEAEMMGKEDCLKTLILLRTSRLRGRWLKKKSNKLSRRTVSWICMRKG